MRGKTFKEKDFKQVKELLKLGLKARQIMEITGWSKATIYQASGAETHRDYVELNHKRLPHYQKQSNVEQPKNTTNEEKIISLLEEIVELLSKKRVIF